MLASPPLFVDDVDLILLIIKRQNAIKDYVIYSI